MAIAKDQFDILALAAARLSSEGKKQQEIAQHLGVSQPDVSRLLRHAEKEGWLRLKPLFIASAASQDLVRQADEKFFSFAALKEKMDDWASGKVRCNVRVIHTSDRVQFGRAAADRVAELIVPDPMVEVVGVLWGRTIDEVVKGMEARSEKPPREKGPVNFVPLCGEPLYLENLQNLNHSASALAARLEVAFNGKSTKDAPSLAGVPAYLSTKFAGQKSETIREFISDIPGYGMIFGRGNRHARRPECLINRLDAVITGVGTVDAEAREYIGTFIQERMAQEKLDAKTLAEWVYGDIGGILIPRPQLRGFARKRVEQLNQGLTGIEYDDFKAVASRSEKPGVIVIASSPAKAEMIREIIKQGLVNQLIIDRASADGLLRLD
jgi:DNA-binding transcriptional regulator LsrR (DeoR family)